MVRRVCIVTPLHLSMNPRVVKEADALAGAGYDVGIIAPNFSLWGLAADKQFDGRLWRIVSRPWFGPESPRLARLLELSRRLPGDIAARLMKEPPPGVLHAALHPATPLLVTAAGNYKADLYIAHVVAALPAAALAARKNDALYAFDAEDYHPGEFEQTPGTLTMRRLIEQVERRYLPGCCYVTAASPLIASAYRESYGIALPEVILNVFPGSDAPESATPIGSASPGPSVYWYSQTIGPDRGLECAVRAIGIAASRPHLYLRGSQIVEYCQRLKSLAESVGASDRLHFLPLGKPSELVRLASSYDIGFVGETGVTNNRNIQLTNKQFTYLLAGLPVVMSDIEAHKLFAAGFEQVMSLFRREDPTSLALAFDRFLQNPDVLAKARADAYELGQHQFNWDREQHKFLRILGRVLTADQGAASVPPPL